MPDKMQRDAINCASEAIGIYGMESGNAAEYIRSKFDRKYDGGWNCIVGPKFNCSINPGHGYFIMFCFDENRVVLFKHVTTR